MHKWLATSLQRRLSVVVAASMIVPMLALGLFAFMISSNITEEKTKLTGSDMLKQMDANLRFMLEDIETLSIFLIGERDLQTYLTGPEDNETKRTELVGRMTNLAASKPYIANIAIYPERFDGRLSTATWYENELPSAAAEAIAGGVKTWSGVYAIRDYAGMEQVMTLFRPIRSIYDFRRLGWLAISLDERELAHNLESPEFGQGMGKVELVGADGMILSSADKSRLGQPLDVFAPGLFALIPGGVAAADDGVEPRSSRVIESGSVIYGNGDAKSTVLYRREPLTGWMLVGSVPYDQYQAENRYILTLTAMVVGVSVLACTLLIWFTVRRITRPLRVLTRHLSRIDPERPLPRFPATSDDEIGRLGQSYNMLGAHIERLKREVIRGEARKKEADLRALQAQINPHFLYNTLSSIHWIALMSGERRIADMVEGLSDFLRISLNQGRDYCPVEQEVAHIRNYVRVQSIRFPDKFAVEYIVDEGLEDKWMLKLLLQPLVENALIHGVQKREGIGTITILIQPEGKRMNVMVMDNGLGMSTARLEEVRQALSLPVAERAENTQVQTAMPGTVLAKTAATAAASAEFDAGYGLRNVNERLLLHYGREAVLSVDSREGEGTQVSFSIPIMEGSP